MTINTGFRRPSSFDEDALLSTENQVITSSGNSASPVHVGAGTLCEVFVSATSISGTSPTLTVTLQGDNDAAFGSAQNVAVFPDMDDSSDPATLAIAFRAEHDYLRASWSTGGSTPSFTTTISVRA